MYIFTDQSSAALILTHSNADLHIVDDDGGEVPHDLLPYPPLEVRPGKLVGHLIHHELQHKAGHHLYQGGPRQKADFSSLCI